MTHPEQPPTKADLHLNPEVVEWSQPQEGLAIRLHLNHPAMESISPQARESLQLSLGRMALLCDFIVAHSYDREKSFQFLAAHLQEVTGFYHRVVASQCHAAIRPLPQDNDFPF